MLLCDNWKDYELIDCSNGEKLERWGNVYLLRPDPQIIWNNGNLLKKYDNINAHYHRSNKGHTGLFPEQAVNWDFMVKKIEDANRPIKVLNLFAYTGGATVACLSAGASVVHVDSSRGMVEWAKENVKDSNLADAPVRYIVDDVVKFVKREIRRNNKYDAIIMDPPSYGRGANNEVWDIEKDLFNLVTLCTELLSEKPLFFIINSYTTGLSKEVFKNILEIIIGKKYNGKVYSEEIGIPIKNSNLVLPCGICSRYESN